MLARSLGLLALVTMMPGLGAVPARAAETVKSAVAARVIFAIPYWIAERKGYFKDEGIDTSLAVGLTSAEITAQTRAARCKSPSADRTRPSSTPPKADRCASWRAWYGVRRSG